MKRIAPSTIWKELYDATTRAAVKIATLDKTQIVAQLLLGRKPTNIKGTSARPNCILGQLVS